MPPGVPVSSASKGVSTDRTKHGVFPQESAFTELGIVFGDLVAILFGIDRLLGILIQRPTLMRVWGLLAKGALLDDARSDLLCSQRRIGLW